MRAFVFHSTVALLLLISGCGEAEMAPPATTAAPAAKYAGEAAPATTPRFANRAPSAAAPKSEPPADRDKLAATVVERGNLEASAFARDASAPALQRKIIYDASIGIVVADFAQVETKIVQLVQQVHGYIAEMQITGSPGSVRTGHYKVRVPVEAFESFLHDVAALGELENNHRTSQDVTEQYYDIDARIKNKQVEEERLVQILKETTGKIEDVLRIETELSRVRGEIEQMQGRLRVLENLSSLTTIDITVRERDKYQPAPPVAASFETRISATFEASIKRLTELGQSVVLFVVDWGPWTPLLIFYVLIGWLVLWVLVRIARRLWQIGQMPVFPSRTQP